MEKPLNFVIKFSHKMNSLPQQSTKKLIYLNRQANMNNPSKTIHKYRTLIKKGYALTKKTQSKKKMAEFETLYQ